MVIFGCQNVRFSGDSSVLCDDQFGGIEQHPHREHEHQDDRDGFDPVEDF